MTDSSSSPDPEEEDPWEIIGSEPEEFLEGHPFLRNLFHYLMLGIGAVLIFVAGGGFAFLVAARYLHLDAETGWSFFLAGGATSFLWAYRAVKRKGR